ncbi:rhamnogalacturonan lyase family protein [Litchfieldia salsa]|uniref:Fibronectin type 3 domain-containing protein n=1 Tax=Litchfieldia salsa TaxID=930152 RepID=A0A1H0Q352_9BACI|nr:SGNH/GDSL hydrolase family protein [Litchfieldia salsa]SDP11530.1 fibronectin type 3 domain-containing protein [Litchfieldia salsa]
MSKRRKARQYVAIFLSALMVFLSIPMNPPAAQAEEDLITKKFDFGTSSSPVQDGYVKVAGDTGYSKELTYGFSDVSKVSSGDNETADALKRDYISTLESPFLIDLPNGDYTVTVIAGDDSKATNMGMKVENIQKIQNTDIAAGQFIDRTFDIAIVDGQLSVEFTTNTTDVNVARINGLIIQELPKRTASEIPSVYIAGDSTVQTYDEYWKPEAGWGQMIDRFFTSDIKFLNHSIGGRSSKSFIFEGRLDSILREIKPNDFFLIQFGHNDATISRPERYASVPDYKEFLKTYINGARQRGATPILVTPVGRRSFNSETGKFNVSFPEYVQGMKEVAEELDVDLVDLSTLSREYYDTIGPEGTLSVFLHTPPGVYTAFPNGSQDDTHFQEYGAIQIARLLSGGIKGLNNELSPYVADVELPAEVPTKPTGVTASSVSNAGALLSWNEVEGADIYKVFRKLASEDDSAYKLVGSSTIPRASLAGMEDGKSYHVQVVAVNGRGDSQPSDVLLIKTKEATLKFDFGPVGSPVAEGYTNVDLNTIYTPELGYGINDNSGMITRDRGDGDTPLRDVTRDWLGYFRVGWEFKVDVPNGLYAVKVYVADFVGSARTDVSIEGKNLGPVNAASRNWTSKVFSDVAVSDGQMNLRFSGSTGIANGIELTPILIAPSELKAEKIITDPENPSVDLTWKAVEDAAKYNVYRKVTGTKDFKLIKTVETNQFNDNTIDVGMKYDYVVTTIDNAGVETVPSMPLTVSMIDPDVAVPSAPVNLKLGDVNKNDLTFSWDKTEGAQTYNVYRAKKKDGTYQLVGKTKGTSYKDDTVLTTIKYYYKVSAVSAGGISELSDSLETPAVTVLKRQMESIDRGLVAMKTEDGVYLSWRLFGTDSKDTSFNLYRNKKLINSEPITSTTNYVDKEGTVEDQYEVRAVIDGAEKKTKDKANVLSNNHFDIPLQKPADGVTPLGDPYSYRANDASVGDLDGDGEYEIILKWDPTNSKDSSQSGYTGNVYIDAYKLDGTLMWRIDLGKNIRAGAHYTQFLVYDFDGDGKAEVSLKTADGTIDGQGNVIGRAEADHRYTSGYVLQGDEFLTVFEGATGKELVTTDYHPPRGDVSSWGDSYGNRVDRFLAGVAYLDGEQPSIIMARGYYTRTVVSAYNYRDGKLTKLWTFDTNQEEYNDWVGQGYHSLSVADVDHDGKDEIVYGQMTIDDDGTGLYNTGLGHGDALHVSDLDPTRPGQEIFAVQENKAAEFGYDLRDAETGEVIWGVKTGEDTGRGMTADIDPNYPGAEAWAISGAWNSTTGGLYSVKGEKISENIPSSNFGIWWDGDLQRELLDHKWDAASGVGTGTIDKWDYNNKKLVNLVTADGTFSNNSTKGTPSLSADILGDWREEAIWRTEDSSALRVFMTTDVTEHKIYTLMHDSQYRLAISWQNVGYNQPPHPSFFIGHGMEEPPTANIYLVSAKKPDVTAPETTHEIVGEAHNDWYRETVTVNLTATDSESEVDGTYFTINDGETQTGNSVVLEEEGKYTIQFWSEDEVGNVEEKKEVGINIDRTAPAIQFSVENGTEFGIDEVVTFSCTAEDALSGIESSTCEEISEQAYKLGLGEHTFNVEAVDVAGNQSSAAVTITVTVNYDSLGKLTETFLTENGHENSVPYLSKLEAAKAASERGNIKAQAGPTKAYINHVKAQTNKQITEEQSGYLIKFAEHLVK